MTKLLLKVDPDRVTIDDLIALEEGKVKVRAARDLVARFVVGDNGEFMADADAQKLVGKLTLRQLMEVGQDIGDKVRVMMTDLVPTKTASE